MSYLVNCNLSRGFPFACESANDEVSFTVTTPGYPLEEGEFLKLWEWSLQMLMPEIWQLHFKRNYFYKHPV